MTFRKIAWWKTDRTNNIIINNGLHPHVWYLNSGDVFKNNIVFNSYKPAIMDKAIASDGKWGKELDYNFFVATKDVMNRFSGNDNCSEEFGRFKTWFSQW